MIIRSSINSDAFLEYTSTTTALVSGGMLILTQTRAGNFINGPLSVSLSPTSVRFGGIYKFNPMTLTALPSTIISPISTFVVDIPLKDTLYMAGVTALVLSTATKVAM